MVAGYCSLCRVESCRASPFTEGGGAFDLGRLRGAAPGPGFWGRAPRRQRWDRFKHLEEMGADPGQQVSG